MPAVLATDVSESDPPDIDCGDANLYLVYTRVYAPGDRDLFVRRSTNLGMNWDSEVRLANSTDYEFEPRVAATYGGGAVVATFTRDYGAGNTDSECYRSTDAGTTWAWSPGPAVVDLSVLDVQGRRIRRLERGVLEMAGSHAVNWDGRSDTGEAVASGVYFCRLEAGAFLESKRMVLVR